jgi:hypothetical protein
VLNRVLETKDATLGHGLFADVGVFLTQADHSSEMAWTADDRRKYGTGRIIAGEASLTHTGAVVDNERGNITAHPAILLWAIGAVSEWAVRKRTHEYKRLLSLETTLAF